jgi:hypothetical protein
LIRSPLCLVGYSRGGRMNAYYYEIYLVLGCNPWTALSLNVVSRTPGEIDFVSGILVRAHVFLLLFLRSMI